MKIVTILNIIALGILFIHWEKYNIIDLAVSIGIVILIFTNIFYFLL